MPLLYEQKTHWTRKDVQVHTVVGLGNNIEYLETVLQYLEHSKELADGLAKGDKVYCDIQIVADSMFGTLRYFDENYHSGHVEIDLWNLLRKQYVAGKFMLVITFVVHTNDRHFVKIFQDKPNGRLLYKRINSNFVYNGYSYGQVRIDFKNLVPLYTTKNFQWYTKKLNDDIKHFNKWLTKNYIYQ